MTRSFHRSSSQIDLKLPVERLWPWLTDTNRVNKAAGLAPRTVTEKPDPRGGSRVFSFEKFGPMTMHYEERPFEWVRHEWFSVERLYSNGILRHLVGSYRVESLAGGSCRVHSEAHWLASGPIAHGLCLLAFSRLYPAAFAKVYRRLEKSLAVIALPPNPFSEPRPVDARELKSLTTRLAPLTRIPGLAQRLAEYLLGAADNDLVKIRPFRLARQWKLPRAEVLSVFLKGVRAGIFEMGWNLLCPSCRGPKGGVPALDQLEKRGHCPSCNIDFEASFDESVELNFSPHPDIRAVNAQVFCTGGPGAALHAWFQKRIPIGERVAVELTLEAGTYRLVSPQGGQPVLVEAFENESPAPLAVSLPAAQKRTLRTGSGRVRFHLENLDPAGEITVRLERTEWLDDIVTAAEAAATQDFRDLFSNELIRPGQEIALKSVTLLFTDLKGSTRFYNEQGDPRAFAAVHDHFQVLTDAVRAAEGAVVKTIGDAVMAAFISPERAVRAAFLMLEGMADLNARRPGQEPLQIKLGLHTGPALAVTLNERLDYFGRTVNLAARTEGQCLGDDLVLSRALYERPGVADLIRGRGAAIEPVSTQLKGFDEATDLIRVRVGKQG